MAVFRIGATAVTVISVYDTDTTGTSWQNTVTKYSSEEVKRVQMLSAET